MSDERTISLVTHVFLPSALLSLLWCSALACAHESPRPRTVLHIVVDGATVVREPTAYVVRQPERVLHVRGVGEIHAHVGDDADACRLVWSSERVQQLWIVPGVPCPHEHDGELCFRHTRFVGHGHEVEVDGCAQRNDLMWSKLTDTAPVGVGPTTLHQRCVPIPAGLKRCAWTYLRVDDAQVQSNDRARSGLELRWRLAEDEGQDEEWRVCFLERRTGTYRISLRVQDTCSARQLLLTGDSGDLKD